MKIKVQQRHIDAGERWSTGSCPVALALKEVCGTDVWVGSGGIRIGGGVVNMPGDVFDFINSFDSDQSVVPFEFEFEFELALNNKKRPPKSVLRIADRQTDEFDAARKAIAKAEGRDNG